MQILKQNMFCVPRIIMEIKAKLLKSLFYLKIQHLYRAAHEDVDARRNEHEDELRRNGIKQVCIFILFDIISNKITIIHTKHRGKCMA